MSEEYRPQSPSQPEVPLHSQVPPQAAQTSECSSKPPVEEPDSQTHFGFQKVPVQEKAQRVAGVFHSVAHKYDLMNDLMSMGVHRLWKRITIELSGVRAGDKVLDLAGGTGDLTLHMIKRVGPTGKVVLSDINESMLNVGRNRLIDKGYPQVEVIQADAQHLPFEDAAFDCVTMAFGLRNVTDKEQALREIYRVLKPSGRLLVLEFSKPTFSLLGKAYDFYSFNALPVIGKLITNDAESYRYLAESIRMHPDQETLKSMMTDAGFEQVKYYNMTGGIVALHKGLKI